MRVPSEWGGGGGGGKTADAPCSRCAPCLALLFSLAPHPPRYHLPEWLPNVPPTSRDTIGVLTVNALPNAVAMSLDTTRGGWGDGCFGWLRLSMEPSHASSERVAFASYVLPRPSGSLLRLIEICAESPFAVPVAQSLLLHRCAQARNTMKAFAKFAIASDVHRRGSSVLASEFKRMERLKKVKTCADALVALYERAAGRLGELFAIGSSSARSAKLLAERDARFVATNCHVQLVASGESADGGRGEAAEAALALGAEARARGGGGGGGDGAPKWKTSELCVAAREGAAATAAGGGLPVWGCVTLGAPSAVHTLGFDEGGLRRQRAVALGGAPAEADSDPTTSVFDRFQHNAGVGFSMGGTVSASGYALELRRDVVMAQMLGAVASAFAIEVATRCTDPAWWSQIMTCGWVVVCESLLNASEHELAMLEDFADARASLRRVGLRIRLPNAREADGVGWSAAVIPSRAWHVALADAKRDAANAGETLSDEAAAKIWAKCAAQCEMELEVRFCSFVLFVSSFAHRLLLFAPRRSASGRSLTARCSPLSCSATRRRRFRSCRSSSPKASTASMQGRGSRTTSTTRASR